jgi:hypothetical protein
MPPSKIEVSAIVKHLINGQEPLSFKLYDDGFLTVILPSGKKTFFDPVQVQQARHELTPKPSRAGAASSRTSEVPTSREVGPKPTVKAEPAPKKDPPPKIVPKTPSKPPKSDS